MKQLFMLFFVFSLMHSQPWYLPMSYASEKRFEDQSFFFSQTYINPYGSNEFSSSLVGIVDDPLLNLQRNPAEINDMTKTYMYFTYRTNRDLERKIEPIYYPYLADLYTTDVIRPIPYQPYESATKLSVEPAFSSAVIAKPSPELLPALTLGMTYELITQSEPFYSIEVNDPLPYDIMGRATSIQNNSVDQLRNTGHFLTLFSGYRLTNDLDIGLRIGTSLYTRTGQYGPQIRTSSNTNSRRSYFQNNNRGQNYSAWDLSFGLQWHLTNRMAVGASAGYLTGEVSQSEFLQYNDSYSNDLEPSVNFYKNMIDNNRNWKHVGNKAKMGVNSKAVLSNALSVTALYSYSIQQFDISLQANDINEYESRYQSSTDTNYYASASDLSLIGNGNNKSYVHFVGASLSLKTANNLRITLGVAYSSQKLLMKTNEHSWYNSRSNVQNKYLPYRSLQDIENKSVAWDYHVTQGELQIPLLLDIPSSEYLTWHLWFNRKFLNADDKDALSIEYLKREQYKDGVLQNIDPPMNEYAANPNKSRSINSMSLLVGLSVQPKDVINIRLVAIPYTVHDELNIQWFASISVLP